MESIRRSLASNNDVTRALRAIGGLLLAAGFIVALFRKSGGLGEAWGDGAWFALVALPCAFLLGLGFLGARASGESRAWQAIYIVFGLILLPITFAFFVNWVAESDDAGNSLNLVWSFGLTAAAAAAAAIFAHVRYGLFIASIAFIVAWLALWNEILTDGLSDLGTLRGLFVIAALIGLAVAWVISTRDRTKELAPASELLTAAGLAALVGTVGLSSTEFLSGSFFFAGPVAEATFLWDLAGLLVALALIGAGARFGARGPAYAGALALLLFMTVVGLDLDSSTPDDAIVGWPLALVLIGGAAVVVSLVSRSSDSA